MTRICARCKRHPVREGKGKQHNGKKYAHGYCRECATEAARESRRRQGVNPPGQKMRHPCYNMWYRAQRRAKKKGLEFTLRLEELELPKVCPVLGIPLDRRDVQHAPSLDRIDPKKGYTAENTRVISFRANSIKQDATFDEIMAVMEYMRP